MLFAVWCVERGCGRDREEGSGLVEMPLQKCLFLFRGVPETGVEGTSKDVYGGQAGESEEEEEEEEEELTPTSTPIKTTTTKAVVVGGEQDA